MSESHQPEVHVVACGVLALDIEEAAARKGVDITTDYLPGGLHQRPAELRERLQKAIDAASEGTHPDRIIVGYGLCGRGTVGIQARSVPLVIPRVQDCIALFLGSDEAYRKQFKRYPGTYYISAGWFEEKVEPLSQEKGTSKRAEDSDEHLASLAEKYGGRENARAIVDFYNSWKDNYQRAAFIDTGVQKPGQYAEHAQRMAEECDWKYERIEGDLSLLEKALQGETSTDELLLVPPGQVTAYDAVSGGLKAVPRWEEDGQSAEHACEDGDQQVNRATPRGDVEVGLGIDAGGTYTDVVVYDFSRDTVLGKSKSLTTRWDYTVGIQSALDNLDPELVSRAGMVAVSTTLATNAIVEGEGQRVGLLVMPPYGIFDPSDVDHRPAVPISGRLDINGEEREPVCEPEVRSVVRKMLDDGIGAFAVSGFASTINPAHEMRVKEIVREETGCSVSCGHELSDLLNFRTRAMTAVLNARIIPRLQRFLREVKQALDLRGIHAPIMTVKGDGSLMNTETAARRPVETILSGPAASVAGARYLTGRDNATVVDMGGTTTDAASLQGGEVEVSGEGTRVGRWQTHVRALRMRTAGLGGDSSIAIEEQDLKIGPRRVAPLAWLATADERARQPLEYGRRHIDEFSTSSRGLDVVVRTGREEGEVSARDAAVLEALADGPCCLAELAERVGRGHWTLLNLRRLEEEHLVQRSGLTPTDLLHARGTFRRWNTEMAEAACEIYSELLGMSRTDFVDKTLDEFVRRLALEIVKKQVDGRADPDVMDECEVCKVLTDSMFADGDALGLQIQLRDPVIGIGAPVHYFLPKAGERLNAEVIVPHDADVANAIGAITSHVVVSHTARIQPTDMGHYVVEGLPGAPTFPEIEEAHRFASEELRRLVRRSARQAGTTETDVHTDARDRISSAADGTRVFIERVISARIAGAPDAVGAGELEK